MESAHVFIEVAKVLGLPGVMLLIFWLDGRRREDQMTSVLKMFEGQKSMYDNNVELVKRFIELSDDLKEIVIMNTQGFTRLSDDVNRNQYCPMVRLRKDASGREG